MPQTFSKSAANAWLRRGAVQTACMVGAAALAAGAAAPALAKLWDGGGVNSQWNEPANWDPNGVPMPSDTATILNDTALITGYAPPPVLAVELGLGSTPGGLTMSATAAPAGLNVVTNVAVASAGSLSVGGGGSATSQLTAGSLLTSGSVSVLNRGTISLAGQFAQSGGTVSMTTDGTLSAASVVVQGGMFSATGVVNGSTTIGNGVGAAATLSPGPVIGDLAINGNLKLQSDAELEIQFRATGGAGSIDSIDVSGRVTLGGSLNLSLLGAGEPTPGAVYTVLSAGTFDGDSFFAEITGLRTPNGSWATQFDLTSGIRFSHSMIRGDMNGDGNVDVHDVEKFAWAIRDADTYRDMYINVPPSEFACPLVVCGAVDEYMADVDRDNVRTWSDIPVFLDVVEQNGGNSAVALATIAKIMTGVPEPASGRLGLVMAVSLGLAAPRRRGARSQTA